jgi:hypothetical protein
MSHQPSKWYEESGDNSPFIKALAEVRRIGAREAYCYQHMQAIMLSIDQYAESALGIANTFGTSRTGSGSYGCDLTRKKPHACCRWFEDHVHVPASAPGAHEPAA